jgi:hypothetical protein
MSHPIMAKMRQFYDKYMKKKINSALGLETSKVEPCEGFMTEDED